MRISDWSSDVCSSDLSDAAKEVAKTVGEAALPIAKAVAPIAAGLPPETAVRAALDLAGPTRQNSEIQLPPPARSLASTKREGPLFDQARSFPKVQEPVRAIGTQNPPPRVRAQGMGLGFASLIKAARALSSRDQGDMSAAAWKIGRAS